MNGNKIPIATLLARYPLTGLSLFEIAVTACKITDKQTRTELAKTVVRGRCCAAVIILRKVYISDDFDPMTADDFDPMLKADDVDFFEVCTSKLAFKNISDRILLHDAVQVFSLVCGFTNISFSWSSPTSWSNPKTILEQCVQKNAVQCTRALLAHTSNKYDPWYLRYVCWRIAKNDAMRAVFPVNNIDNEVDIFIKRESKRLCTNTLTNKSRD